MDRIQRAYRAGLRVRAQVRAGVAAKVRPTSPCGLRRKEAYVVLLAPGRTEATWCRTYSRYLALSGGRLCEATQGHSWASQAEATAYCLGAGLEGLPKESA